jgi:hypothetical protein
MASCWLTWGGPLHANSVFKFSGVGTVWQELLQFMITETRRQLPLTLGNS